MKVDIYEIKPCPKGQLAIMPRPRGGDWLGDEMISIKSLGVSDIVSMLTTSEEVELELEKEEELCAAAGLRFHRHSIPDRDLPLQPEFDGFIKSLLPTLIQGGFILIHCRAGIGRSSVVAAALLSRLGVGAHEALSSISKARGFEIPDTDEQKAFILSFGKSA
jgi:protein tyrosine/serine phosphatase